MLQLFDDMQQREVEPDVITFNALISACEKEHQAEKALQLFDEMQQRGLEPDVITHTALCSACGNGQEWSGALHSLMQMKHHDVLASGLLYVARAEALLYTPCS